MSTPQENSNPLNNFIHSILSYDSNIMLAAIISLLLVILFVLLLHIYAKWFLVQARNRNDNSVALPHARTSATPATSPSKGLSKSVISSIPLFVYIDEQEKGLECTICLGLFEDEDVCRRLPKCEHAFHVDCIDMWLFSHSTCPICRGPIIVQDLNKKILEESVNTNQELEHLGDQEESVSTLEIIVDVPINEGAENNENRLNVHDPLSATSSSSLASSLRRMLTSERRKVSPSTIEIYEKDKSSNICVDPRNNQFFNVLV